MSKKMFSLWCEWDIGQENVIFASREAAFRWATEALEFYGVDGDPKDLLQQGLIGFSTVTYIDA